MNTYVSYLRQSTSKQAASNLGVEAQREIIRKYLGDPSLIIREYVETESGRKSDRPRLAEALELCRQTHSVLICAKLDRLSRNVAFTSRLLESDVEIVFCDFPKANRLVLHIISSIAEYEAQLISERTRLSLQVKKSQGVRLGKPENLLGNHGRAIANSVRTNKQKAAENENNRRASALIVSMRRSGNTYSQIARALNAQRFRTDEHLGLSGFHLPGSSSSSRNTECSCIRSSTSVSHTTGLTPQALHVPSNE